MASIHGLPDLHTGRHPFKGGLIQDRIPLYFPWSSSLVLALVSRGCHETSSFAPSSLNYVSFCCDAWHIRRRRRSGWSGGRGHVGRSRRSSDNACMTNSFTNSPTRSGSPTPSPASARSTWVGLRGRGRSGGEGNFISREPATCQFVRKIGSLRCVQV